MGVSCLGQGALLEQASPRLRVSERPLQQQQRDLADTIPISRARNFSFPLPLPSLHRIHPSSLIIRIELLLHPFTPSSHRRRAFRTIESCSLCHRDCILPLPIWLWSFGHFKAPRIVPRTIPRIACSVCLGRRKVTGRPDTWDQCRAKVTNSSQHKSPLSAFLEKSHCTHIRLPFSGLAG